MDNTITDLIEKQEHIETAARALKAISHPLRLKILCVIGDQEACVQEIVDAVGTSQSNISQHLAILQRDGLVRRYREDGHVLWEVVNPRLREACELIDEIMGPELALRAHALTHER